MKKITDSNHLEEGKVEIWYQKNWMDTYSDKNAIDPDNLEATHAHIGNIDAEDEEDAFCQMQGENWSPRGEAVDFIVEQGLMHTSMMVGDVIVIDGRKFRVDSFGFSEVGCREEHRENG